jgi:acyl-CoA hydrolase
MNVDECIADLRSAIGAEIALARRGAIEDLLEAAARVRGASTEVERHAALEEASRTFAGEPAALGFLRTLASSRITPEDQHLRAQRFARVRVAEIQLYHAAAMKAGRASGNVYAALRSQMDAAREAYREQFLTPVNGTADYLHGDFVRTLANDDAALLGPDYPGSLV